MNKHNQAKKVRGIPASIRTNMASTIANMGIYWWNESQQALASKKLIPYKDYMGYVSDIAFPAYATSSAMLLLDQASSKTRALAATAIASALTMRELLANETNTPKGLDCTFDIKDIACYWASATAAYAISEFAHSGKMREYAKKAKNAVCSIFKPGIESKIST